MYCKDNGRFISDYVSILYFQAIPMQAFYSSYVLFNLGQSMYETSNAIYLYVVVD